MKAREKTPAGARRRSLSEAMGASSSGAAPGGLPATAEAKKKITLNIGSDVHKALRYHALDEDLSLEAFLVKVLSEYVSERKRK